MTTYYIDPLNGNNSNDGLSTGAPKLTVPTPTSNNTYLLKCGTTYANSIVIASAVTGVTLSTYGAGDKPIINPGSLDRWSIRVAVGCTNTTISGFECTGALGNGSQTCFGIYIGSAPGSTSNNVTIRDCFVHNITANSAGDCNGIYGFGDNITITNCFITQIPDDGIWIEGKNTRITHCKITNVGTDSSATGDCIQLNGETASSSAGAFYIAYNYLNHSANLEKQCFIVSSASLGLGGYVGYNTCVFPMTDSLLGGNACLYSDQPGCVFEGNTTYGGTYGILIDAGQGQKIRNNLILNAYLGINTANSPLGLLVDNNTIANCVDTAAYLSTNDVTTYVRNNVFINCPKGLASHGNISKSYNAYYNNSIYTWGSIAGGGTIEGSAILVNPLLSSTFTPKALSPLIGGGSYLYPSKDITNRIRKNLPTVGAYEYVSERADAGIRGVR